jgi:ubiquinone/menaquinone biosynthesis C-methylase UbiE
VTEDYSLAIANHYRAYRPPLHETILALVISKKEIFESGLDVGCGTGYSSIALAKYCSHIYGVDPSAPMLEKATRHEKVTYLEASGEALPVPDNSMDIVTFAGSLFYTKSLKLVNELKRVCRDHAPIIPYDFELLCHPILSQLGIKVSASESGYDHQVNLSDFNYFTEHKVYKDQIDLQLNPIELAHVLLSSAEQYDVFVKRFNIDNPFEALAHELTTLQSRVHRLKADIYFSRYSFGTLC